MSKPRLLDLFCGAGHLADGYAAAGFEVVGVDIEPQPHYPFEFHQADALTYPLDGFDAVHASPPCEAYTKARHIHEAQGYPDLLGPIRKRLLPLGVPWVIENVPGAPIRAQLLLCGTMFGLPVHRHRYFELNWSAPLIAFDCNGGTVRSGQTVSYFDGRESHGRMRRGYLTESRWAAAAGMRFTGNKSTRKGVPPAYTEWIGRHLLAELR